MVQQKTQPKMVGYKLEVNALNLLSTKVVPMTQILDRLNAKAMR